MCELIRQDILWYYCKLSGKWSSILTHTIIRKYCHEVLRWICHVLLPRGMGIFPLRGATKLHIHRKWTSQYFHYYILLLYFTYVIAIRSVHVDIWYFLEYKPLGLIIVVGLRTAWRSNIGTRGIFINEPLPPRPPPPPPRLYLNIQCSYKPPPCT